MPVINLVVVNNPANWQFPGTDAEVVAARDYLSSKRFQGLSSGARVFNLCRGYAYQSIGYYVSLLAEARGHRAIPDVATLRDFDSMMIVRSRSDEIDDILQSALKSCESSELVLRIVFGQSLDGQFPKLAYKLYRLFPAPLLKVHLALRKSRWQVTHVHPLTSHSLEATDRERIPALAAAYFKKRHSVAPAKQRYLYDLAIVVQPDEPSPPSDEKALQRFTEAARETGFFVERITTDDLDRIKEFDAVFIRQTTAVNHPVYRLARLAYAEGLAVIDDPWSILRSTNKIYLYECLSRARIPTPKTWILTKDDLRKGSTAQLSFPCVLKLPDGAFSIGMHKVDSAEELNTTLQTMLQKSELIIAQAFVPSEYDWRIGVLDGQPLYACKYFMARGHWQIYNWAADSTKNQLGESQTLHIEYVPRAVVDTALRAASIIGDGLYGVDLKQFGDDIVVIEVNDNPSIESGIEDKALGMELYRRIARSFRRRIEALRGNHHA
jgi:glutathione synthase/RimK-type ligase-like ATP-grasp enzyme